jgi:adenine/guanine phosphoribosyltransferase-like PRPP-binding protein/anti-sigma regulatory factor (Ser/Thr protein kinase)
MKILFPERVTLGALEEALRLHFKSSKSAQSVQFDLTSTKWIGLLPSAELWNWATHLVSRPRPIKTELMLPPAGSIGPLLGDVIFGLGLARDLAHRGVSIETQVRSESRAGFALETFERLSRGELESLESRLLESRFGEAARTVIEEAVHHVLFELLENAGIHGAQHEGHFIARVSTSSGRRPGGDVGVMRVFPRGTEYLELLVWDQGPGIETELSSAVPDDYKVPWQIGTGRRHTTRAERVLAWAFEFSSTSNPQARLERISAILESEDIPVSRVATGLFNALNTVRHNGGQLVVRSTSALLSFDFAEAVPVVSGARELGGGALANLPGTHYLLRLPLHAWTPTVSDGSRKISLSRDATITVVSELRSLTTSDLEESTVVHDAISLIDAHLGRQGKKPGIVLIPPVPARLSSRALAVLATALSSLDFRDSDVIWLDPAAEDVIGTPLTRQGKRSGAKFLIGDPQSGRFAAFDGLYDATEVSLEEEVLGSIRSGLAMYYEDLISQSFRSPETRLRGRFLIPGRYYTDTYYYLVPCLESSYMVRACAYVIALKFRSEGITLVVTTSRVVTRIAHAVAEALGGMGAKCPDVISRQDRDPSPAWVINAMLDVHNLESQRVLVISDVICTTETIISLLSTMLAAQTLSCFTLVDARPSGERSPLATRTRLVQVHSFVAHPITPHHDFLHVRLEREAGLGVAEGTERVFVIDARTKAPTLFQRSTFPRFTAVDVIRRLRPGSPALNCGHLVHNDRHYVYFLDVPQLTLEFRTELEEWFRDEFAHVHQTREARDWNVMLYNPDGSLTWLKTYLSSLAQRPKVLEVSQEELAARPKLTPGRAGEAWIGILPVMASAKTLMRFADFLAEKRPSMILFFAVAVRSAEWLRSFLANVTTYKSYPINVAFFLEFPFGTFGKGREFCPLCHRNHILEAEAGRAKRIVGESSSLGAALEQIAAATQAEPIARERGGSATLPTKGDLTLASLRALYEQSATSHRDSKLLNRLLVLNPHLRIKLLEVIALEYDRSEFSIPEIQARLYKTWELLLAAAYSIVDSARPGVSLNPIVWAIVHLIPGYFSERVTKMMLRYSTSIADVEILCAAALLSGLPVPGLGELLLEQSVGRPSGFGSSRFESLALELHRMTDVHGSDGGGQGVEFVEDVCQLWAQLARTSQFDLALDQLLAALADRNPSELAMKAHQVSQHWSETVMPLVVKVRIARQWRHIARARGDANVLLGEIEKFSARIGRFGKEEPRQLLRNHREAEELEYFAITLKNTVAQLASYLYGFFGNPAQLSIRKQLNSLTAETGVLVRHIHIEQTDPLAFCDVDELEAVCSELIQNWRKLLAKIPEQSEVWFRLEVDENQVSLVFGDTLEGEFDFDSWGGLRSLQQFCRTYSAVLDRSAPGGAQKELVIRLRRIPSKLARRAEPVIQVDLFEKDVDV